MFGAEPGGLVNLATARERDAPAAHGSREEGSKLKSFRKQEQSKCRTVEPSLYMEIKAPLLILCGAASNLAIFG